MSKERSHDEGFASAETQRPCVKINLAGSILNNDALSMLVQMLKTSFAEDYRLVDIHITNVSRMEVPDLTASLPDSHWLPKSRDKEGGE
jgi:hypothetical protein